MTRIRFEDLPSTNTPRNAENLNKLNNVVISPTEPTTGEEVWIQKGKNLFNVEIVTGSMYSSTGGLAVGSDISSNRCRVSSLIKLKPNTTYTISTNSIIGHIWLYSSNNFNTGTTRFDEASEKSSYTFTTGTNALYFGVWFESPKENIEWIMLEQGSIATSYESYIDKKIYTKNDNGIYEEFYDETNLEVYSTSEQRIGTWIDGKPLYRRVLSFPNGDSNTLTGAAYTLSEYGITNVSNIFITHPSYYSYGKTIRYPFSYNDGNAFECNVDGARLIVKLSNETIANSPFLITLEYTKTTD